MPTWIFRLGAIIVLLGLTLSQVQPSVAQPIRNVSALRAKALAQGSVRVLVGVRAAFTPEGKLSIRAAQAQRTEIAQAQNALLKQMAAQSVRVLHQYDFIPYLALDVDAVALDALATAANVTSIEEDKMSKPSLAESTVLIGATAAWASGYAGAGQTVAILDTGVDKTHPFLSGKVVSEACYSTTYAPSGSVSFCPGGASSSTATGSGVNCSVAISGCSHGTHVAGIAAGRDNGSIGYSGVARDANIIAIQVFSRIDNGFYCFPYSPPCIVSWDSDQISALGRVYALNGTYNIAAANLSLGGSTHYSTYCDSANLTYKAAIDNLRSVGIATVIASGNESNESVATGISEPACISTAVSVGSTKDGSSGATPVDTVSSFSNSASILKLLAPGEWILSSVPGGGTATWRGTSMATPHVVGAWAVLKSRVPSATVDQVLSALTTTGVSVTDSRNGITKPRIRLDAALNALAPPSGGSSTIYFPLIKK